MKICLKCESPISRGWDCPSCRWSPSHQAGFPLFAPGIASGFDAYSASAHDRLPQVEESHFWFVSRNKLIACLLDKYFPQAQNMMEIGCGTGFVLSGLAKNRPEMAFHGAEACLSGLKHAQKRLPGAGLYQMDACRIPFAGEFDIIGAFDVLEHIADDRRALKEMHKALKPDGGIMITVPQHPWLWSKADENARHQRRYTRTGLHEKIKAAGFAIHGTFSFIALLLPFMAASRFREKGQTNTFKEKSTTSTDFFLPEPMNRVFMRVCDLERALVRVGFSFPAGGSLVCIAKKQPKENKPQ